MNKSGSVQFLLFDRANQRDWNKNNSLIQNTDIDTENIWLLLVLA